MLDVTLFGLRPSPPHLLNAALHAAGAVACFLVLDGITGRLGPSAAVAMLVAWHLARVESVAWVAERKDVLAAFFFMLVLQAYERYCRLKGGGSTASRNALRPVRD